MTVAEWSVRVEQFWRDADDEDSTATLAQMRALVSERPEDDAVALTLLACRRAIDA